MKNSFERATSPEKLEESKKKLKAFRSEIYNNMETGQKKKNAFTMNKKGITLVNRASKDGAEKSRDNKRGR